MAATGSTRSLEQLLGFRPEHLAWPIPEGLADKLEPEDLAVYLQGRKLRIERSESDPLRYGYVPKIWDTAEEQIAQLRKKFPKGVIKLCVWGGNRSGKTRYAANFVNRALKGKEKARWWCCDSTEAQARANQMRLIWEQFPPEWKDLERGQVTDIRYALSDGFPKNLFVCPNGSECSFKFYSMDIENLPGPELDGIWCFTAGTRISVLGGELPIERIKPGDLVETRSGYAKVIAVGSRVNHVGRVSFSNGEELVGTSDHPILTTDDGWTKLSQLKVGDKICAKRVSNGADLNGTRMVEGTMCVEERRSQINSRSYIGKSINCITATYRRSITFITKTATSLITRLRISNVYREPITCDYISHSEEPCLKVGVKRLSSGQGVVYAELFCGENSGLLIPNVSDVAIDSPTNDEKRREHAGYADQAFLHGLGHFAARNASISEDVGTEKPFPKPKDHARYAENPILPIRAYTAVHVVESWRGVGEREVFNLRCENHEYFANNICVHNCDELVPLPWVESLIYRLANRNGILLITFTPEFGWNETFGHFFEGAQALEEVDAKLLPRHDKQGKAVSYERVPRVMQCADPTARIVFFHTPDNPFGNYEAIVQEEKAKGNNRDSILVRVYGVCSKSHRVAFPMFSRRTHVITRAQFRKIESEHPAGARYHLVDPCDGRNWFMGWIFCPSLDRFIVYREWPSFGDNEAYIKGVGILGPWALSGAAADGVRGPAQDSKGFSLERYKEEIEDKESLGQDPDGIIQREEIFARYIDSRYATQRKTERETVTTLQEQCAEIGMEFLCMTPESRILGARDGSIDMINSALFYDTETELGRFSPSLGRLNQPKLQVVETCPNMIWALEHWTGQDGQRGACKDPIDVLRGAFLSSINFVDASMNVFVGGGIR